MALCTMEIAPNSICLIFNGKRKSGKDYTVDRLDQLLKEENIPHLVLHISAPIKSKYAAEHCLNFPELLTSGPYKEKYRAQMVKWAEQKMAIDPYFFSRTALNDSIRSCSGTGPLLVIVADARRPADIAYFTKIFGRSQCLLIKIEAPTHIRIERGWTFVDGIDNATTECGLDSVHDWDIVLTNDGDEKTFSSTIHSIISTVKEMLRY